MICNLAPGDLVARWRNNNIFVIMISLHIISFPEIISLLPIIAGIWVNLPEGYPSLDRSPRVHTEVEVWFIWTGWNLKGSFASRKSSAPKIQKSFISSRQDEIEKFHLIFRYNNWLDLSQVRLLPKNPRGPCCHLPSHSSPPWCWEKSPGSSWRLNWDALLNFFVICQLHGEWCKHTAVLLLLDYIALPRWNISSMHYIYELHACHSEVNDESVASILALSQLVSLAIFNTGLTERGQVNCTITYLPHIPSSQN